jgi:hypothetical protein
MERDIARLDFSTRHQIINVSNLFEFLWLGVKNGDVVNPGHGGADS